MSYKAKIKDMRTLEDFIQERIAKNPALKGDIAEARADLEVAIQIAFARESSETVRKQPSDRSESITS